MDEVEVGFIHEVHFAEGSSGETVVYISTGGFVLLVEIDEETYGHHNKKEG